MTIRSMFDFTPDEESAVHSVCPFCGSEYAVVSGVVRHGGTRCEAYDKNDGAKFLKLVQAKESAAAAGAPRGATDNGGSP